MHSPHKFRRFQKHRKIKRNSSEIIIEDDSLGCREFALAIESHRKRANGGAESALDYSGAAVRTAERAYPTSGAPTDRAEVETLKKEHDSRSVEISNQRQNDIGSTAKVRDRSRGGVHGFLDRLPRIPSSKTTSKGGHNYEKNTVRRRILMGFSRSGSMLSMPRFRRMKEPVDLDSRP